MICECSHVPGEGCIDADQQMMLELQGAVAEPRH
jgi:hypothetical protein